MKASTHRIRTWIRSHPCPSATILHGHRQQKARAKIKPTKFPVSGDERLLGERRRSAWRRDKAMLQKQTHQIGRHEHTLCNFVNSNPIAHQSLTRRVKNMAQSVHLVRLFDILLWSRSFISIRPSVLKPSSWLVFVEYPHQCQRSVVERRDAVLLFMCERPSTRSIHGFDNPMRSLSV